MPGRWGPLTGDAGFNLWHFESVWSNLRHLRPLWNSNIFFPQLQTLLLSENQFAPALLTFPLRLLLADGVWTLNVLGFAMVLAAFYFCARWLKTLSLSSLLADAGALLFILSPWLRAQSLHYQNLCVFVFPLALWTWARLQQRPKQKEILINTFCWGWIGLWNLYFLIFGLTLLVLLILQNRFSAKRWDYALLTSASGALFLAALTLMPYVHLASYTGAMKAAKAEFIQLAPSLSTFFRPWVESPSLLQSFVGNPFGFETSLEKIGTLGVVFMGLLIWGFFRNHDSRRWVVFATVFACLACAPSFGLASLLQSLPAYSSLRAIGRALSLTTLLTIPAVMWAVSSLRPTLAWVLYVLLLVDFCPTQILSPSKFPSDFFQNKTEFSKLVESTVPQNQPVLLWQPTFNIPWMLYSTQFDRPIFGGYSGRALTNSDWLYELIKNASRNSGEDSESIERLLKFSGAKWIAVFSEQRQHIATATQYLGGAWVGCADHGVVSDQLCLYHLENSNLDDSPWLNLEDDFIWEISPDQSLASLKAKHAGVLDYKQLGECASEMTLNWGWFSWTFTRLLGVRVAPEPFVHSDQIIFEDPSKHPLFRLPPPFKPQRTQSTYCLKDS
jgi:hypothetical protein